VEEIREHQIEEATDLGSPETPSWFRSKAVAVHLYTASGAVLALLMLVAAFQGEAVRRCGSCSLRYSSTVLTVF